MRWDASYSERLTLGDPYMDEWDQAETVLYYRIESDQDFEGVMEICLVLVRGVRFGHPFRYRFVTSK